MAQSRSSAYGSSRGDTIEEVGFGVDALIVGLFGSPCSRGLRGQLGELPEIPDHGSEVELVPSAVRTSEANAIEAGYAFSMREQHLDFLTRTA